MERQPKSDVQQIKGILEEFNRQDIAIAVQEMGLDGPLPPSYSFAPDSMFLELPSIERTSIPAFGSILMSPVSVLLTNGDFDEPGQAQERGGEEKLPDEEDEGGVILVNEQATAPNQYHSMTRTDCVFQVVNRSVEIQRQVSLASLQYEVSSFLIQSRVEMQARLTRLLQSELNLGLAAQMSTATGIPLVPNVGIGGKAGLTARQSAELAARFVNSIQADLIIYIVHVSGNIWARKVAKIDEVWQWVGDDCERLGVPGQGWENSYTLEGPWTAIPVNWYFTIPELKATNVPARGNAWARGKAKEPLHDSVRGLHKEFQNVPKPPFIPDPV